jgi:hypothetical protein
MPRKGQREDLSSRTFGAWFVESFAESGKDGKSIWWCRCVCGNRVKVVRDSLINGDSSSCGCRTLNALGLSQSVEYRVWHGIQRRCYDSDNPSFADYGGRGITVCERWRGKSGFSNFLADMGKRPSSNHQIDRKDNNGPYSPENCRWATPKQQTRNTRRNRLLTLGDKTKCVAEWAEELGVDESTLRKRLDYGWSPEKALTTPVRNKS